ncbi:hypothetical protein FHS31_000847 [Sphingomonas vulcanisoli]|uniref:Uncharacterized protein n=1 Tax=Sphingomonas vulcanisoli TaxID=1658060 RepID=A0ABX0TPA4_9SPHN|nr:hypothetical protein [Sphingomonas vulcanisoli]NIJ07251.1 hypothetical protein [Sphingomonas vulcanisoli]
MKMLARTALALSVIFACAPALADIVVLPQVKNAAGANVPSSGAVSVDSSGSEKGVAGNPTHVQCDSGCSSSGGSSTAISRTQFVATASGTGYGSGDQIEHVVATNPATSAVTAAYWLDLTSGMILSSAPSSANLAAQPATEATLASIAAKLNTLHSDLAAPTPAGTNLIGSVYLDGTGLGGASSRPLYIASTATDPSTGTKQDATTAAVGATQAAPNGTPGTGATKSDQVVAQDMAPVTTTSLTSTGNLLFQNMTGYAGMTVQMTSVGTGNTITVGASNDSTTGLDGNWTNNVCFQSLGGGVTASITAAPITYYCPSYAKFLRINVSVYSAGTVSATGFLRSVVPLSASSISTTVGTGTSTIGNVLRNLYNGEAGNISPTLAANTTGTGGTKSTGAASGVAQVWNRFVCSVANLVGPVTLYHDISIDGTNWGFLSSVAIPGTTGQTSGMVSDLITTAYNRCRVVNGGTAQTAMIANSAFAE